MWRYYFHLKGPDLDDRDEVGLELAGVEAAWEEVRRAIPDTFRELFDGGHDPFECRFEVTDRLGRVVFETPFSQAAKVMREARSWAAPPERPARLASAELAQAVFSRVFEGSPAAHLMLTPDQRILAANQAYLNMTGLGPDRLLGLRVLEAFPQNPAAPSTTDVRVIRSHQRAITLGRCRVLPLFRYDEQCADGDWRKRYWRTISRPVRIEGGPALALDLEVIDLTARVEASLEPGHG
jgi:PAS domain S-box-containing protein